MRFSYPALFVLLLAFFLFTGLALAQTTTPTPGDETGNPATLVVWWPESLAPEGDTEIEALLLEQFRIFEEVEEGNVTVEFRRKAVNEPGGIMPTLQTASSVAPGALPDLALIRREDLLNAEQNGLVQSLEGYVTSAVISDLDSALQLGRVGDTLYGLPYLLEIQHIVYRTDVNNLPTDWSFAGVLAREEAIVFPANRVSGVLDEFFVQYLDAGGRLSWDGELMLISDALESTLSFYQSAREAGIISENVLDYSSPSDYLVDFSAGTIGAGVFGSSVYLALLDEGQNVHLAPIPTQSGNASTVLNGWVWVMTTPDVERQTLASRFLAALMDAGWQGQYASSLHMLPSQLTVLQNMLEENEDLDFINSVLSDATLPLPEGGGGPAARAMQDALISVISGERTAEEATEHVVEQLEE